MWARFWMVAAVGMWLVGTACGGPSPPETDVESGAEEEEGDEGETTEPDEVTVEDEPEARPIVPEMLADCESRDVVDGAFIRVQFQCDPQLVSYYESPVHIEHIDVVIPLTETPGFRVDVEAHEVNLAGSMYPASILYHTDEVEDVLVFALYVVTQDLPSGGTRVINCFMMPSPEQVAWCDDAVRAIASIGRDS